MNSCVHIPGHIITSSDEDMRISLKARNVTLVKLMQAISRHITADMTTAGFTPVTTAKLLTALARFEGCTGETLVQQQHLCVQLIRHLATIDLPALPTSHLYQTVYALALLRCKYTPLFESLLIQIQAQTDVTEKGLLSLLGHSFITSINCTARRMNYLLSQGQA